MIRRIAIATALVAIGGVRAHADPRVDVAVETPTADGEAPQIIATVFDPPTRMDPARWSLAVVGAAPAIELSATTVRPYAATDRTLAVVILYEGMSTFIGTTDYEHDPDMQYPGVFHMLTLVPGLFHGGAPAGSLGGLVRYDKGARVVAPPRPLVDLDGAAFGTELDYRGMVTRDLVAGVEDSLQLLRGVTTERRILVIVGDGADTNPDLARAELPRLRKQCERDRIELYAVAYSTGLGDDLSAITSLVPDVAVAPTADALLDQINAVVLRIMARQEIVFPGRGFPWDGKNHEVQLRLDGTPWPPGTDPVLLRIETREHPPSSGGGTPAWLYAIGLVVAAAVTYALVRFLPDRGR